MKKRNHLRITLRKTTRCLLSLLLLTAWMSVKAGARETLSLDQGWRFHLGDIPFPVIKGHDNSYNNAKAGKAWGAAAPEYDDSQWRLLNLPHDWVVEGPFDPDANLSQGYRPRGISWYRRQFQLSDEDRGRHLEIQFDGVATHCTVWVNGILVHRNWCGYTSFPIDITPFARFGDELNTIAVRVDADAMEGWWYEGGGIYRHTWLVKRDPVHVVTDGVFANPIREADGSWKVPVEVTLENSGTKSAQAEIAVTLVDPDGREVARKTTSANIDVLGRALAKTALTVSKPKLWSVDHPVLYRVSTAVSCNGRKVDAVTNTCGFRTIRFDAEKGFFLNDQPLKIKGVCNHQDHAGVGVAVPDALGEFRLRKLKEMGANAYRCAHNPPAREFLDACDRMGMLVMDENRNFNTSDEYVRQLEWLVRRDRNHPSVILWSVFNEEPMQGTSQGYEMVRRMSAAVKRLDTTRPVTAAQSNGQLAPVNVSQAVDLVGFNYQIDAYDTFHVRNPRLPVTSSEDTSGLMTRGEYVTDHSRNVLGAYDTEHPPWGETHRVAWKAIATRPYLAGGFVWTGFDYRGEPTPFQWPSVSSFFGCMDTCGFPKTAFYLRQAWWLEDRPVLTLVPHWNWAGSEGRPIKVMAITNADTVALTLNGKALEEKKVDPIEMAEFQVPYEPGKLEALAKKNGREVARFAVETTGAPVALEIIPDRKSLAGDGADAMPVTIRAVDAQGREVPTACLMVNFETSGPAKIIGVGNGDPNCHEPEKYPDSADPKQSVAWKRSLFNGLAQVIVQSERAGSGKFLLRATASGLKPAEVPIQITPAAIMPSVESPSSKTMLLNWMRSRVSKEPLDPNITPAENDMNSWTNVQAGASCDFTGGYAVYRTKFEPIARIRKNGGQIVFESLSGSAEVWLDGKLACTNQTAGAGKLSVPLPAGEGTRTISVLIKAEPGQSAGLIGRVSVEAAAVK